MYQAELINRFDHDGSVDYDCVMVDDEGIMPDRREQISIPSEKATERYIRSLRNLRCAYHEEQYFSTLSTEGEALEVRPQIKEATIVSVMTVTEDEPIEATTIDSSMMMGAVTPIENNIDMASMINPL